MATVSITRRGIVGAMMIAPAVVAAPVSAQITSDFIAKLAAYRAALRAERTFDATVYKEASDRFNRMEAALPHHTVEWRGGRYAKSECWSTADIRQVSEARAFLDPKNARPIAPEQSNYHAACVELTAAADARYNLLLHASEESGFDAAAIESDRLCDLRCAACDGVVLYPVRTTAELAAKIAVIKDHGLWDGDGIQEVITSDVARIAQGLD